MTEPRIGDLRHHIRLEEPVGLPDGGGGASLSYSLVAEIWAEVRPREGREAGNGDGVAASQTHEVWMRWRPGVTTEMRFVLGTRVLEILSVVDTGERRRWLKCLATERRP